MHGVIPCSRGRREGPSYELAGVCMYVGVGVDRAVLKLPCTKATTCSPASQPALATHATRWRAGKGMGEP